MSAKTRSTVSLWKWTRNNEYKNLERCEGNLYNTPAPDKRMPVDQIDAYAELVHVADAEIKRLVELLREAHKQAAKMHMAAGSSAFSTKEFELEKEECGRCAGSGATCEDAIQGEMDICGKCKSAGEVEIVPSE